MAKKNEKDFWKKHFIAYEKSGLTQTVYCKKNKLNRQYFSRLYNQNKKENKIIGPELVEIKPIIKVYNSIKLNIGKIYSINIPDNFSKESLSKILDFLESRLW